MVNNDTNHQYTITIITMTITILWYSHQKPLITMTTKERSSKVRLMERWPSVTAAIKIGWNGPQDGAPPSYPLVI